tara:strand:- start:961 stop:2331 length:1371 start_codon:yes stop_codon:yes gene_type:complete
MSIKVLSGAAVIATLSFLAVSSSNKSPSAVTENENKNNNFNVHSISDANSNIRAVSVRLNKIESKNEELRDQIRDEFLSLKEEGKNKHTSSSINNKDSVEMQLSELQQEIRALKSAKTKSSDLTENKPYFINEDKIKPNSHANDNYINLDESSRRVMSSNSNNEPLAEGSSYSVLKDKSTYSKKTGVEKKGIPFYTIPAGSAVQNATLLTSLIGEVPLNGKVSQPLFPFSSLISRGQLMAANGVPLPKDLIGMKIGGFSFGVGSFLDNISCVRAYATSALFLFKDGHFVTVGDSTLQNSTSAVSSSSIGYLTDKFGSPCIKGSYHTNAPNVLSSLMLAGTAEGLGKGVSAWQQSTIAGAGGLVTSPTGNFGSFIGGHALGSTPTQAAEWLKNRIGDSFDFVYVPASVPYKSNQRRTIYKPNRLMLHFTQTIAIDKDTTSRRVNYEKSQTNTFDDEL